MSQQALAAEERAIVDYDARIRQEEIERILAGWNELNLEPARNEDRWQDDGGQR
jgi:hypothetical protein